MSTAPVPHVPIDPQEWTTRQDWASYTAIDHDRWNKLFSRQRRALANRAIPAFNNGLEILNLSKPGIPDFTELSDRLSRRTRWEIVAVPGLIPDEPFFRLLASRRFPASNFIRDERHMDYLQEPDIFHDVFGHVPLLADPVFADYMQAYGEGGLRSLSFGSLAKLARLYWYTVEFGLIRTDEGLRIYGAGIVSSRGESAFALDSPRPNRLRFSLKRILRTKYRIDDYQQTYFVIDSFDSLLKETVETDFAPLYAELAMRRDLGAAEMTPDDDVIGIDERCRDGIAVHESETC